MEQTRFEFTEYDVTDCRFGRPVKGENPRGKLVETVDGFHAWVCSAKHLSDTRIESPGDELYVKESAKAGNLFCVVLWKRVGAAASVCAINANDPPNAETKVKVQAFETNDIPGEPLYFILDPSAGRMFAVRSTTAQRIGHADVCRAMRFFMGIRSKAVSSRCRMTAEGPEKEIIGTEGEEPAKEPTFKIRVKRQKSMLDRVLENPGQVNCLVHTIPFKDMNAPKRKRILKPLLQYFHKDLGEDDFDRTRYVSYKIAVDGLVRDDVEKAISAQENALPGQKVGFRLKNTRQTLWADSCLSRQTVDLDIASENGIFSAVELLKSAGAKLGIWL